MYYDFFAKQQKLYFGITLQFVCILCTEFEIQQSPVSEENRYSYIQAICYQRLAFTLTMQQVLILYSAIHTSNLFTDRRASPLVCQEGRKLDMNATGMEEEGGAHHMTSTLIISVFIPFIFYVAFIFCP